MNGARRSIRALGRLMKKAVQPLGKIFRFRYSVNPKFGWPSRTLEEGRFAIVTNVGAGCDGRSGIRRLFAQDG
jgi:hypothetical protein